MDKKIMIDSVKDHLIPFISKLQSPKEMFQLLGSRVQKIWTGIKIKWANDGDLDRKKKIDRKAIRWRLPKKEWIKNNFDGASKGNKGVSGARVVFRNEAFHVIMYVE